MDSNRFVVFFPVLLLAKKHSSLEQAEEDVVFSENANMLACVIIPNARICAFMRVSTERRRQQKRARAQRESKREREREREMRWGDVEI